MKQNYLFSSLLCDSEMQHTFHFIIWDCFPFVVNQMGFQILAPFEHFLQVSTIFRSTLDKINYVLSSMISKILHLSVCILRVALPVSTVFFADGPYVVLIYPSSYSTSTLFSLLQSFSLFLNLVPTSASGLPIPCIESFHPLFRFLNVWYSGV